MEQQIIKVKNKRGVRVIPGFGVSLGVTLSMLGILVLIPLASILISASRLSLAEFLDVVTSRQVISGYVVSLSCAFFAALVNALFGLMIAWVLVRYDFPGKRFYGRSDRAAVCPANVGGGYRTDLPLFG